MKRFDVMQALSGALYALAVTFGALMCPVTAFQIPVDPLPLFLTCAALCLLFAVLCGLRRVWFAICAAPLLLGALLYLRWEACVSAFFVAAERVVACFSAAYSLGQELSLPDGIAMAETANAFLVLPAVILAFLCTFSLEQRRTPVLCAAAGLPFLVLCLFILETVPAAWAVLLLTGALALAFLTQSIRRESGRAACRLSALLALPLAVLIGLLVLISPPGAYERGAWQESLQSSVSSALDRLSLFRMDHKTGQMELVSPFSPSTLGSRVWDSSVERVDLSRVGPQSKTGRHVMDIRSPLAGTYHLRADSMAAYQDSTWTALPKSAYAELSVPEDAFLSETQEAARTLEIKTDMKSSICYLPYKPVALPEGMTPYFDAYVRNSQQATQYSIDFSTRYRWSETSGDSDYSAFVRRYYLEVPDDLRASLLELDEVRSLPQASVSGIETCTKAVTALVQKGKTYSLETARVPSGEDFVYWFLTQSDTGYCVHFATSAALLLRYCGVPARYVTGYTVSAAEGEPEPQKPDESAVQPKPEKPDTPVSEPSTGDSDMPQGTMPSNHATEDTNAWQTVLFWVLGILAAAAMWFGYRILRLAGRSTQLTRGNLNRQAVMHFRHLRFLSKLAGCEVPPELEALALKAKFSQHRLTPQELVPLKAHCDALTHELMQEKRPWKRFLYRMVYVIY